MRAASFLPKAFARRATKSFSAPVLGAIPTIEVPSVSASSTARSFPSAASSRAQSLIRPSPVSVASPVAPISLAFSSTAAAAAGSSGLPNYASPRSPSPNKTSIMFTLANKPGALKQVLDTFAAHNINITRLETKPCLHSTDYEFHVDFDNPSDSAVAAILAELRAEARSVGVTESKKVPWFPRHKRDLDVIANDILAAGSDLDADHPGFSDPVYRARRSEQTRHAFEYKYGDKIPRVDYTPAEVECWGKVYTETRKMQEKHACAEHMRLLPLFEQNCGYSATNVPQLQDISDFLSECTGFTIRPVAGLLSTRNFLYGLAFRTFFSTQYLRHHSKPLYTPEPDLVHEIMGHVPLFADQDFADFSQEIGLASIGATDEQIEELGRCYWFSVEFGLCKQGGELKAYGAGLLSSFGELQYSMGLDPEAKPELRPFDPFNAAKQTFPITTYQPVYYVADSFQDAKVRMKQFSRSLSRPFNVRYNPYTGTLDIDANVKREAHVAQGKVDVYAQDKSTATATA